MKKPRLTALAVGASLAIVPLAGVALTSQSASASTPVNAVAEAADSPSAVANGVAAEDARFFGVVKAVARGFTAAKAPQAAGRVLQQAGLLGYSSTTNASAEVEAAFFDR